MLQPSILLAHPLSLEKRNTAGWDRELYVKSLEAQDGPVIVFTQFQAESRTYSHQMPSFILPLNSGPQQRSEPTRKRRRGSLTL